MLVLAADVPVVSLVSVCIGLIGLGGLVFTALRFRRDDTTAIVQQQSVVFADLKSLNEELRSTVAALRVERDTQKARANNYEGQAQALRIELHDLQAKLPGATVSPIQRKP